MSLLPLQQTSNQDLSLLQTKWKSIIDPILSNISTNPLILKNILLVSGVNVINHKLGRTQQGWYITDINSPVSIYRSQPFNDLTLTLTSSGAATISLVVF